jgi:serine/threonine protein kinase
MSLGEVMSNSADNFTGKILGTSILEKLIGQGGMGSVYLAKQTRPSRFVAIKILLPNVTPNSSLYKEFLTRFRREADVIARLEQINIIPIYEYGEQDGMAYLVMPYLPGGSLRDLLARKGVLSLQEVVIFIDQAAAAPDYAHGHGVVHRDLKPGNFLLSNDGRLVLADFGIARMIQESDSTFRAALTGTGILLGTPEYMAPEMLSGEAVDHRSDIYALGIVLFQMLSGHVPFKGNTPFAVATKHLQELPSSLHQMNPSIPIAVDSVIQRALAKKREDRFDSAGAMASALRTIVINPGYLSETQERNAPTIIFPPKVIPPAADQRIDAIAGTSISIRSRRYPSSGGFLPDGHTQPITPYPAPVNSPHPWLIFIGILLVLIFITGGVLVGLQLNKGTNGIASSTGTIATASPSYTSNPTVGSQSTSPSPATSGSTPTTGSTQSPAVYPNIAGFYSGPIINTYANINSNMTLSINQNQSSISGQFTVALPLQGTGPFIGTIDTNNTIQFTVVSKDTAAPILFQGTVNSDGSLSGNYCSVNQANQCDTSVGGHGTWMVTQQ